MRLFPIILMLLSAFISQGANAITFDDRVISSIEFEGLDRVTQQRVLNLIQATVGQIYNSNEVQEDVHTLTHLGEFNYISADVVLQEDGTVHLIYKFKEQQILTQVSVVGNTTIGDKELLSVVPVLEGLGRDQDAIDRGKRAIMAMYEERGNYLVEVQPEIIVYGKDVDEITGQRIDESVVLIYKVMEGPRVRVNGISFSGNNAFTDDELTSEIDTNISIPFFRRGELNEQVLEADVSSLKRFYINRGYRDIRISYVDPLSPNDKEAAVVFLIEEGPQYIVGGITTEIHTEGDLTSVFSEEQIRGLISIHEGDVYRQFDVNASVREINSAYGVLGRIVTVDPLSPNDKEAAVVFLIEEGPQYIVGGITTEFHTEGDLTSVFSEEQIRGLISVHEGDVYRQFDVNAAVREINSAYGVLGRIVTVDPQQEAVDRAKQNLYGGGGSIEQDVVRAVPYHSEPGATIEILFVIDEGLPTKVGLVEIMGNTVTKDKVIRGRIGLKPGQPFNIEEARRSEERLMRSRLFRRINMTIQPENKDTPGYRDLLVEVEETRTGTVSFGVIAGSDSGLVGNISIDQQNFDVTDFPETWDEFLHGKSFVGAGQQFTMAFQPGDEIFNYEIGLTDPRFLDTDYSLGGSAGWTQRNYEDYTQEKLFSSLRLGRKLGDVWYGSMSLSANRIKLTDIDNNVPVEIFNDRGPSTLNSLGMSVSRTTLYPVMNPYEGSRTNLNVQLYGIPSGDYTFTKSELKYTTYFAIDRDFLNRTSTLRIDAKLGYIFGGDSPTFERYYLGGRNMRGFDYRTISPKGTPRFAGGDPNVPIGGNWRFFLGAQYEFPVVDRFVSMVLFCDSGTVTDSPSFEDYRVSIGYGIRLHIPQLGNAPLAFDFGFPVIKQELDNKKMFSFSIQLPF